ncbi:ARM repeat superfamily protein [Zea mays]|uniref:ARM repeat superfamily protein n=1 Tax=Zea mays TaxID=4577 RepID=A0A1D6JWV0_MAIZE|nr:ARM repeat superfamily protein [Zea mays]
MAQSLELLLIQFLMPDNDARRQAEEQIRRLARDPQVVPALVHHLRTAKTPNVRQLAAVLLRKKITSHWPKLPADSKASLKQALIDSITLDHSHPVRRASANVVSIIAKYAIPAGEWPELLPFLFQCSQSPQEDHREVALILFSSLTETIGATFQSHLNNLQPILLKCLQDETSSRVRIAALKAVGSFIEYVNDGGDIVKMFRDFVPSILNISRQCLANGEEDVASIAFEIFDELIESPAPLLGDSVRSIVQFSLEVSANQDLEINIRQQAIQIISWLVKFKASFLKKHKLVVPILQVMCPLLTETANEDEDSDLAADRSAAEVIDTMAINLPRHVLAPVLEFASLSFHHINPKYREAAVTSLGVISEGCCEHLKDKLEDCLKIVLEALKDQEQMVRGAASFALGQFAEHLQPEILSHYASVLPCILNALEDPSDEVKEKSYYALAAFCEDMGEDILPYLEPLICRLVMSLQSSPRNLQETCMSAIGSVAAAAEQAFTPYAEKVLEMMKGFMVLINDEDLCARARATEVVGIVAMAVGRARIEAILPPFIEASISGFGLDYSELREYTHGFFSNVAEILGDSFTQYLPHVVPLVFSSCNLDDGSAVDIDDADSIENGFGGVSSDDDVNDEPRVRNINILTAVRAIPPAHADVLEKQKDVLDTVLNIYIKTMTEDDDKEVVAQACMSVADIVKDCGFAAIEPYMLRLAEVTLVLLRQESSCQQVESDGEDDGDIDHDEVLMDAVSDLLPAFAKVMGSYFDPIFAKLFDPLMKFAKSPHPPQDKTMVVATLAEVAQEMGAPISAYVDKIMPLVLKELASSDATNRRNAAFCAGEICKNGGAAALKYYGDILRSLHNLFSNSESDDAVRDNAAGAIARMIMVQPQSIPLNQVLPVFIKALPLKEDHEESMTVYGCVCGLLLSSHPQILPLVPDVIHVFAQVVVSPDESDEVKTNIGKAISHLISVYGQQMQPILSALPPAHANALASFASRR